MKSVIRSAYAPLICTSFMLRKNFTKGYSDIQVKVREATANEEYGPTMGQLDEIARASFNPTQFSDIIYIIDKRLNDHGKNWRHVYKTLLVMEYCICCGADSMVSYAKERLHEIKTLREFISLDDQGNDNGASVREKSKDIVALLTDDNLLSQARRSKNPPIDRRPQSIGPLTIDKADMKSRPPLLSASRSHEYPGASYPGPSFTGSSSFNQNLANRRSFEDLQDVDEEQALAMALEYSKAEFESSRIMQDEKDSGYPALLKHASRSSSARSSTHNLTSIESLKKEQITAEQLLDLDDDTFAQALESSYLGSRHNSTAQDQDSFNNPFETSQYQGPTIVQAAPQDPFLDLGNSLNGCDVTDPFNDNDPNLSRDVSIHPIALPGRTFSELQIGAKPVMPGNLAPQFENQPAKNPGNRHYEAKTATASSKDPFEDLF